MDEHIRQKRGHWESFDDIDGLGLKRITNYELRVTNCKLEGEGIDD